MEGERGPNSMVADDAPIEEADAGEENMGETECSKCVILPLRLGDPSARLGNPGKPALAPLPTFGKRDTA